MKPSLKMFNKDIFNNVGIIGQSHWVSLFIYLYLLWKSMGTNTVWLTTFLHITNNMSSAEDIHSYRSGTTWGWINDDRIFIFGWNILLNVDFGLYRLWDLQHFDCIKWQKSYNFIKMYKSYNFRILIFKLLCNVFIYAFIIYKTFHMFAQNQLAHYEMFLLLAHSFFAHYECFCC